MVALIQARLILTHRQLITALFLLITLLIHLLVLFREVAQPQFLRVFVLLVFTGCLIMVVGVWLMVVPIQLRLLRAILARMTAVLTATIKTVVVLVYQTLIQVPRVI